MLYGKFIENILLPVGDFLNGSNYVERLKYWRRLDACTEDQLSELQKKNLSSLLKYSVENVKMYSKIDLKGTNPFQWINQFPVMTKEVLRSNYDNLISKNIVKESLLKYSSSGSTGTQTSVFMNKREQANIRAILTHWWEWSGYNIGDPLVQTGISPNRGQLKKIKDFLFKTIYVSAFSHTDRQLGSLFKKLEKAKEFYLAGYASSLDVIAQYALSHNHNVRMKAAISFGDKLFTHYKKNIQKAFKCDVFDTYGSNEGFLIACQKDLEYKYIMSPHVYLEILNHDNTRVPDGKIGHVVVTRLDGYSMPLIRYKIGDLAIKLPRKKYPQHRVFNYPLLQQIIGRETDVIQLHHNKKMGVHSFTGIFEYIPEIKQFQVIQNRYDSIHIHYIKSETFTENALKKVRKELLKHIKEPNFKIKFREVKRLVSSRSGKPQIVICNLKNKC